MAELADALDLGSSGQPWGFDSLYPHHNYLFCGSGSVVEHRLAKARVAGSNPVFRSKVRPLYMRMWYNGRTSAFQADDVSSILIIRSIF